MIFQSLLIQNKIKGHEKTVFYIWLFILSFLPFLLNMKRSFIKYIYDIKLASFTFPEKKSQWQAVKFLHKNQSRVFYELKVLPVPNYRKLNDPNKNEPQRKRVRTCETLEDLYFVTY